MMIEWRYSWGAVKVFLLLALRVDCVVTPTLQCVWFLYSCVIRLCSWYGPCSAKKTISIIKNNTIILLTTLNVDRVDAFVFILIELSQLFSLLEIFYKLAFFQSKKTVFVFDKTEDLHVTSWITMSTVMSQTLLLVLNEVQGRVFLLLNRMANNKPLWLYVRKEA